MTPSPHPLPTSPTRTLATVAVAVAAAFGIDSSRLVAAAPPTFREPWRPQFHFTPASTWMNDPNGMVWHDGEFHLFYQNNPFGDKWGHMSWAHAVSRDLSHWEHLPLALAEEGGVMIFSGSAVVDRDNTSGFGKDGKPPMVAIYTGHHTGKPLQNQHIAYSNDRGRTWTKYAGNPVLDLGEADFRDPKVFWHAPTRRWVMAVSWPQHRQVRFYASPDLKRWSHLSDFGPAGSTEGIWECPDLFPVEVENPGGGRRTKWVLVVNVGSGAPAGGSGTQYFVGEFDGTFFGEDPGSVPAGLPGVEPEGRVLADFEDGYGGWTATGDAFGARPAAGTLPNQQEVRGFSGRGLVNTYLGGDRTTGTLTSPEFRVDAGFLNFRIGGGRQPEALSVRLLVDGKAVRAATGGDAERLEVASWDVREFAGRTARIEIVDRATGSWGHINADRFVLASSLARPALGGAHWADFGPDFYAAVTWSGVPEADGRRLWLGWMSNWTYANDVPTSPWRSAMTVARSLTLRRTEQGYRLLQRPVREIEALRGTPWRVENVTVAEASGRLRDVRLPEGLADVEVELENVPALGTVSLLLRHGAGKDRAGTTRLELDAATGQLRFDRGASGRKDFSPAFSDIHRAPVRIENGRVRLRLLVDTSSVEVFAQEGESCLTELILPHHTELSLSLESGAAPSATRVRSLSVWPLRAAPPILSRKP